jgi:hypothetical protein
MSNIKDTEHLVEAYLDNLRTPDDASVDERILTDAVVTMRKTTNEQSFPLNRGVWRIIMKSKVTKLAATVIIVGGVLFVTLFGKLAKPAWALEQAIKALQKYKAINAVCVEAGGVVYDCWARAEPSGECSDEIIMRGGNGTVVWVKDGKTYFYNPQANTVEVENAKTAGFGPWLGPELFELLSKANDSRTVYGKDPSTGRDRVIMTGSITSITGPISCSCEFDVETKLPVSFSQWDNLGRNGAPKISLVKITYFEKLPDSYFTVEIPKNAIYKERPIVIPEANLGLLGNSGHGIPTEGLTQEQACRKILEQLYQAAIDGDLRTIRKLSPLTETWSEELLKAVICPEDTDKRLVEVVEIGSIAQWGSSKLGHIAVVPTLLKTKDGRVWQEKQIIQFLRIDGKESCVVYGPYGIASEVKK